MPKFLAAVLCVTLIATFPKLLTIAFDHAKSVDEKVIAYILLAGIILIPPGLMAFFMWLGHKAQPSGLDDFLRALGKSGGFDDFLRALGKSIGRDKEGPITKTHKEESGIGGSGTTGEAMGEGQEKPPSSNPGKAGHAV